jgi:membrane-associated phospholipid phosphatase
MSRRPLVLLALAAVSACAATAVWLVAIFTSRGRAIDAGALQAFSGVARPRLTPSIQGIAHLADPTPFVIAGVLILAIALLRRRPAMAIAVAAILASANLMTQFLKPALADPRIIDIHGTDSKYLGSWPSGHSTAAMSLALCCVLVVGPRLRPLAAVLGAAVAIAIGYALVVLGWHLPSDVLGGYLVAATFTLLGAAGLAALEARRPQRAPARGAPAPLPISLPALILGAGALVAALCVGALMRAPDATLSALQHPTAIAAGAGIAALGLSLTAGLAIVLRR